MVNEPNVTSKPLLQDLSAVGQLVMVTLFSNWKNLVRLTLKISFTDYILDSIQRGI